MMKKRAAMIPLVSTLMIFGPLSAEEAVHRIINTTMGSSGMLPTFQKGGDISIGLLSVEDPIHRCDTIVFTTRGNKPWISRVIGLPQESIKVAEARILVNGQVVARDVVPESRVKDVMTMDPGGQVYSEHLPGCADHLIAQQKGDDGLFSNTATFHVPAGSYFVMSDNRDDAVDSRVPVEESGIGFVPRSAIIGLASATGTR